jgi:hypothetical protein
MKKITSLTLSLVFAASTAMAHNQYTTECYWQTDYWGHSTKVCHQVAVSHSHHHHDSDLSDVEAGLIIGGAALLTAGVVAGSCSPEVVTDNVTATDKALLKMTKKEQFATADAFNTKVAAIAKQKDVKVKMANYFDLLNLKTTEQIFHFIGARKEELKKYESVLAENADLNAEQAEMVVATLIKTLKAN